MVTIYSITFIWHVKRYLNQFCSYRPSISRLNHYFQLFYSHIFFNPFKRGKYYFCPVWTIQELSCIVPCLRHDLRWMAVCYTRKSRAFPRLNSLLLTFSVDIWFAKNLFRTEDSLLIYSSVFVLLNNKADGSLGSRLYGLPYRRWGEVLRWSWAFVQCI